MIDEPLPATEGIDAESNSADETASGDAGGHDATDRKEPDRDASHRSREPATPDRDPREEPDRATDPPPDRLDGDATCERDRGPDGEGDETDESDAREYRLERLRLWRTVVTLAVVVARLLRSL
ncbi:hypothetical protein [Halorubrum trapanicum]|uniref:hypothetical protein n=1 Tax=Halorubrum trapanicum TaxID=29284 RepID=UPI000BBAF9B5|nr:hypothetical protein [Halorubrum trapanicum]